MVQKSTNGFNRVKEPNFADSAEKSVLSLPLSIGFCGQLVAVNKPNSLAERTFG